ncbi:MAG: FG-GAP repeat protein [Gammaproteobacteria bacterium]|nr:FG-GAP repeat protein [Gammaproteobacteria bacterium]
MPSLNPPREDLPELEPQQSLTQAPVKPAASPSVEWTYHRTGDGMHPNGNEQQIVWLMNRARQNPTAEGVWLATSSESDIASGRNFFKVDTQLLQSAFAGYAPKPPAAFDARLYDAAKVHSDDLIARDAQDHNNQFQRITDAGFKYSSARGSVFAYASSALNAHAAWNIDWGGSASTGGMQSPPGHRMATMSLDGDYTNVGIAAVPESSPNTQVGPLVVTGNYCHAASSVAHFNLFIVGTVWRDKNVNGRYDPDEGTPNVLVTPDQGTYYAITSAGGGYAIPITTGTYQVTFSGGGIGSNVVKPNINVATQSVLLDLELTSSNSSYPLTVTRSGSGNGTVTSNPMGIDCGATCMANFTSGTNVTLTATPANGSSFAGWNGGGCSGLGVCTVTLNTAQSITATFNTTASTAMTPLISNGDYNGDQRSDLIWHQITTGQVYGMLLNGSHILQQGSIYQEANTSWRIVQNGDLDGNGNDDLLWWNSQTGQVWWMPMNGLSIANGALLHQEANTAWQIVAVGDLNGDGKDDVIWWNNQTGQTYGMLMSGVARLQEGLIYQEPNTAWRILAAQDFTGDGKADLLWRNVNTGQVWLMPMNGLSIAGGAILYHEPNLAWSIAAVADLDGDGKADLVWWNSQTGQVYGMLMNGAIISAQSMIYQEANTTWQISASGDYNGDGKDDLLWRNSVTGQIYQMPMNGLLVAAGGSVIYQETNADWRIVANDQAPRLPAPTRRLAGTLQRTGSLGGALLNPAFPLRGEPVNGYQPLTGAPLNSGTLPTP